MAKEKIVIGNKEHSRTTIQFCRILYMIIGILLIISGLLLSLVSLAGLGAIAFGILTLCMSKYYKKALAKQKNDVASRSDEHHQENIVSTEIKPTIADNPIADDISDGQAQVSTTEQFSPKYETHRVAGTSFRTEQIISLSEENDVYDYSKKELIDEFYTDERIYQYIFNPINVELIEEPDNKHDPNAIKVVVDDVHVGYIKKGSCSHVKKLMRENRIKSITAYIGGGKYKYVYEDFDTEKYILERDESSYFVELKIYLTD